MPARFGGASRRFAFVAVVVAVMLLHAWLTRELAGRMAAIAASQALPARVAVTYVRTLEPAAPRAVVLPAAAKVVAVRRERAPREPRPVAPASSAAAIASLPNDAGAAAADEGVETGQSQAALSGPAVDAQSGPAVDAQSGPAVDAQSGLAVDAQSIPAGRVQSIPPDGAATALAEAAAAASARLASRASAAENGASATFAITASAPAGAEPFVWPRATRVSYVLTGNYRGEVSGRAEVEWIRDGGRYQVNVDVSVGPRFAPILARSATSEGRLTEAGLAPDYYGESSRFMFRDRRHAAIRFGPESVQLANGQRRDRLAGTQDSASQFIQFSWLFGLRPELLKVGNTFDVPLALPRSLDRWFYEVHDEQILATPFGPLATFHLKPRRAVRRPGEVAVEMWLAPELRFLPVRIRFEQDESTFVDMLIAKKPELSG